MSVVNVQATNGALSPQRLATLCAACLLIDDARVYGLVDGGPEIDRFRARAILAGLKGRGIVPEQDEHRARAARGAGGDPGMSRADRNFDGLMHGIALAGGLEGEHPDPRAAG